MGREVAGKMLTRGHGTIIFTGASASMRGRDGFSAFSGAKHALRALAQSMARELGPKNIHVAHTVIDGAIDSNFIRENVPNVDELREKDALLNPDAIAQNYVMPHSQPNPAPRLNSALTEPQPPQQASSRLTACQTKHVCPPDRRLLPQHET